MGRIAAWGLHESALGVCPSTYTDAQPGLGTPRALSAALAFALDFPAASAIDTHVEHDGEFLFAAAVTVRGLSAVRMDEAENAPVIPSSGASVGLARSAHTEDPPLLTRITAFPAAKLCFQAMSGQAKFWTEILAGLIPHSWPMTAIDPHNCFLTYQ